jgi:hypothetical protein
VVGWLRESPSPLLSCDLPPINRSNSYIGLLVMSHGIHNTSYAQALLISAIGNFILTGVHVADPGVPFTYDLKQNYPNPFNPSTTIDFAIAGKDFVKIQVFDILGKLVTTLVSNNWTPGKYTVTWRGDDQKGQLVASGMYFYRLQAGSFTSIKKMLLLK